YRRDGEAFVNVIPHFVFAIADDGSGGVWLATNRGLDHRTDDNSVLLREADGLVDEVVVAVLPARDGSIWIGTRGGACRVVAGAPHCFGAAEGGPAARVLALHEDASGAIWLGTQEHGLYRYRDGTFVRFGTEHGLPSNSFFSLVEDR